MSPELLELLGRLREPGDNPLSDDELATLRAGLLARATELREEPRTAEVVAELREIAEGKGAIDAEVTLRDEAQADLDRQAEDALTVIDAVTEPAPVEPEPAPVVDEVVEPAAVIEPPAPVEDPIAVAAAAARANRPTPGAAMRRLPAANKPQPRADESQPGRARGHLVASAEIPGFAQGSPLDSMENLAEAIANKLQTLNKGRAHVATLLTEYPEERRLGRDPWANERIIDAATSPKALVATGGVCSPVAVDYSFINISVPDRPIRDSLPTFQADRGGLIFVTPPTISSTSSATGVWTEATDASPGGSTKPVLQVACGATQTVFVDAIPTRLEFGNMQARYFPEQIAVNTALAMAQAARTAETNVWDKLITASVMASAPLYLGAARDLLSYLDLWAAGYRDRHRMAPGAKLRVVLNRFNQDLLRSDFAREIGHQQNTEWNSLAVTDAQIDDLLAKRNILPTWAIDSPTARTLSGVVIPAQSFATQSAGAILSDWPESSVFTGFAEGSFQYLDGGRLDLGVVRDSILDSTNDYETFVEIFEGVAFRGVEAETIVVPLEPSGASAGTVTPLAPTE